MAHHENVFNIFLNAFSCLLKKDYLNHRTMTVRMARGTVFQETWPGAGLKTGDFVNPCRAPEPLPILNPSRTLSPKTGFPEL